jgi:hypothetical protein
MIPSKYIYGGMPCFSCGAHMVLNGPAVVDAEQLHHFINGEETLVEYVCTGCPEHWGFYGARSPESPSFTELMEALK